jgi:hypothetical protein
MVSIVGGYEMLIKQKLNGHFRARQMLVLAGSFVREVGTIHDCHVVVLIPYTLMLQPAERL